MISRLFLVVGLTLMAFSICGLFIIVLLLRLPGHSSQVVPLGPPISCVQNCSGGVTPPDIIADGSLDGMEVRYEVPKQMDINTSDTITVRLAELRYATLPEEFTPFPSYSAANRDIGTIFVGDIFSDPASTSLRVDAYNYCLRTLQNPNNDNVAFCLDSTPIKDIFGSGYEVYASSYLIATGFEVELLGSEEQSISQSSVEWTWNISPKSAGIQMINVDIELRWKPTNCPVPGLLNTKTG